MIRRRHSSRVASPIIKPMQPYEAAPFVRLLPQVKLGHRPGRMDNPITSASFIRGHYAALPAAEDRNVPDPIRDEVAAFFDDQTAWLHHTLKTLGLKSAVAMRRAEALLAGMEGALIIAHSRRNQASFGTAAKEVIRSATAPVSD
jgi:hypothetical protein